MRRLHAPLMIRLRQYLARWGRQVYWQLPVRWRQPTVGLAYRLGGSLFKGLPDYQRWLAQRHGAKRSVVGTGLIDLITVAPLSTPPTGKIAIHAHVYYGDLAGEFAKYLRHMPYEHDLFVSVPNESVRQTCAQVLAKLPRQQAFTLEIVPNRGRDIAPMLCTFGTQLQHYAFIAHIHTKKSLYNEGRTSGWRKYLLDGLLGSPESIRRIFTLLTGPEQVGMVYPQTYATVPYQAHTWLANRAEGERWCHRLGIGNAPAGYFDMPAGSMFWARTDALRPLFDAGISLEDFPPEMGQTDGTFAHTIERLLGVLPSASGWSLAVLRDKHQPSWSRWRVDQYFHLAAEGAFERLTAPDIKLVVFDIFDTLLIRPLLDPEHTKKIVAARVGGNTAKVYLAERAMIEHQTRQRAGRDISLGDIYREWSSTRSLTANELATLRSTEEAVELAAVSGREDAVALLRQVAATGKRVVLASDTFLPPSVIKTMLSKCGVTGWQHLYLSGEIGLRKDTGDLYRHLLDLECVTAESVVMIGDNERSDFQIPADVCIHTTHLLRTVEIARSLPRWHKILELAWARDDLHWSIGLGLIVRRRFGTVFHPDISPKNMVDSAREMGYAVLGPLTVAFAQWLARRAREDGIEHLYFLAREGQLLHRVYEKLRAATRDGVDASYLVLSRRSVTVPMIEESTDIHALAKARFFPNELAMFLHERYGLDIEASDFADFQRRGLWKERNPVEVRNDRIEHLLPLLTHLEPTILAKAASERPALLAHLKSIGLDAPRRSAVVDVGYSATIQARLNRLLGRPVHGYYMVTTDAAKKVSASHEVVADGCFGKSLPLDSRDLGLYRQSFELEKLLSSNDPQVLHYRLAADSTGATTAAPCFREIGIDDERTESLRSEIQAGALAFVDDVLAIKKDLLCDFTFPTELASQLFDTLVTDTSDAEQDILRGIVLDDYYCGRGLVS